MFTVWFSGWVTTVLAGALPRYPPNTPTVTMERVVLPQGANDTMGVDGLRRAAVGNPKVAKARAVPPDALLLTAKTKGRTTVRTWASDGAERAYAIEVVASHLGAPARDNVARVA